jgi:hypothetical protein
MGFESELSLSGKRQMYLRQLISKTNWWWRVPQLLIGAGSAFTGFIILDPVLGTAFGLGTFAVSEVIGRKVFSEREVEKFWFM